MQFPLDTEFTEKNEGYRQFKYNCGAGKATIGIGFNLDDVGLSLEESRVILLMRLSRINEQLTFSYPWFGDLNPARKTALCDMAYQMGVNGLMGFKKSMALMGKGYYKDAAKEFGDSRWNHQTPKRAAKVRQMIESGEF